MGHVILLQIVGNLLAGCGCLRSSMQATLGEQHQEDCEGGKSEGAPCGLSPLLP